MTKITKFTSLIATLVAIAVLFAGGPVFADKAGTPQASITLINCNNELCNANDTAWTLDKTPASQSLTGNNTITWAVTATKGATTDNFISINGFITVKNTGTADATIGNIVVNLQKPRTGPNTGACRNVPWVSAAADVANGGPIPPSWTFCANEGGVCSFSGTQNVRFGSDMFNTYAYGTFTNSTPCNSIVFGDPIPGVGKVCAYGGPIPTW